MTKIELTRRDFLTASAALGVGAIYPPLANCGQVATTAHAALNGANDKIAIGMIGVGRRANSMLRTYFLKDDQFRVVAVCDADATRNSMIADLVNRAYSNSDCATYTDYHELLAREDIDAVVIATPDHWHVHQCLDASKAGKHIYCEKPLTHNLHESKLIIEAITQAGNVVFQTGSQQRSEYNYNFVRAVEYIRSGRIGAIQEVYVGVGASPIPCDLPDQPTPEGLDWDKWLGPAPLRGYHVELAPEGIPNVWPQWRRYREYCAGGLGDMGAHQFDVVQWALGMDHTLPVQIIPPADEQATHGAILVYANGVRVIHEDRGMGGAGCTFVGEKGTINVSRFDLAADPEGMLDLPLDDSDVHLPRNENHAKNWADCIRSGDKPICNVEVGARSAAVCHLLNIGYRLRTELQWDPEAWRFTNSEEANGLRERERRHGYELPRV